MICNFVFLALLIAISLIINGVEYCTTRRKLITGNCDMTLDVHVGMLSLVVIFAALGAIFLAWQYCPCGKCSCKRKTPQEKREEKRKRLEQLAAQRFHIDIGSSTPVPTDTAHTQDLGKSQI